MRVYLTLPFGSALPPGGEAFGADALVFDHGAAAASLRMLTGATRVEIYVRVCDVDDPCIEDKLAAAMPAAPTGLVLRAGHGRDVAHLAARLAVHEAMNDLPDGSTRIIASMASASAAINAPSFRGASPRLSAMTWDPYRLLQELGGAPAQAEWARSAPLAHVRASLRLTAAAAGVEAIDACCPANEEAALRGHFGAARRDMFGAVFVKDPNHIALARADEDDRNSDASGR